VNQSRPDFLATLDETRFHKPKLDSSINCEGDFYQLAKAGSQSVIEWKEHHEQQREMQRMTQRGQTSRLMDAIRSSGSSRYHDSLTAATVVNRTKLPIWQSRDELIRSVAENNVIVVIGETGSGKTTQLTQFLHSAHYSKFGQIVCTQPRRVAAVSVAKRVSDEMGVRLGEEVGYTIRFEDVSSPRTVIRYMTDGILLRESLSDQLLSKYSVIIMDEAHERSLNTDVMFGVLKKVLAKRNDLRVIVTSATMDSAKFSRYFGQCPVLNVSGRTFNVEISFLRSNPVDYVATAVSHVLQVHITEDAGDILVFMTGQDDTECTCELIRKKLDEQEDVPPLEILPIYSQLPADLQARVFEITTARKCIVATNIAETSLTIPGIRYVIDSGFSKQKSHSSKAGLDTLLVQPISQAAAIQRSGRAGRTADGKCWRLSTELTFNIEMLPMTIPEIQRTNLANVILQLKSMGFTDVLSFDFMDRPALDNFMHALAQLWSLRATTSDGKLTQLGRRMVLFPLDPTLSKMLLMGDRLGCLDEVLTIVSMLSVPPVFYKPKGREEEADSHRERFIVPESDHLTLLNVFSLWSKVGREDRDKERKQGEWARENFLHNVSLVKAREVRAQLGEIATDAGMALSSSGDWNRVRKAVCSAYFHQAAQLKGLSEYVNLHTNVKCFLHPSSALAGLGYVPEFIVYHELVLTTKHYLHGVTAVEPMWLAQMAPEFFTAVDIYGNPYPGVEEPEWEQEDAADTVESPDVLSVDLEVATARRVRDEIETDVVRLPEMGQPAKKRKRFGH
jgi:pre-mRNA-splicing factor ATP-dependent RNA helicase DHX38/PRP16